MSLSKTLDPLLLPLRGQYLIEASAGTGKTFTIALLYLRLLLGLDHPDRPPLRVDQILLVTFTQATTQELKERIRVRICELRQLCEQGPGVDQQLNKLLAAIKQPALAAEILLVAERRIDEAAISTIHGFCHRMLMQYFIEANISLSQKLIDDDRGLLLQAAMDYWRQYFYSVSQGVARQIKQEWASPQELLNTLRPHLYGQLPQIIVHYPIESLEERHQRIIRDIDSLKQCWMHYSCQVKTLIQKCYLPKQRYASHFVDKWIAKINLWATQPTDDYVLPDALSRFRYSTLQIAAKQESVPMHPLWNAIEQLYVKPRTLTDLVILHALPKIREKLALIKQNRAEITFDDLLIQLDSALHGDHGEKLATKIRQLYPAALIDEFQDTDPLQYRIFSTLYTEQPELLLILIGDPKQAIYAFRGADIFTYIKARRACKYHYTLDTNWRSSAAMVTAVNHLFLRARAPFIFDQDIPFLAIKSPDVLSKLQFIIKNCVQAPVQFHYVVQKQITLQKYRQTMAHYCADHIQQWLYGGTQKQALLKDLKGLRAIQASDIAILVRTSQEANLIKHALTQRAIPCVYLSDRQSVFSTLDAQELLHLLQAIINLPKEEELRVALASSLFDNSAATIVQSIENDLVWEKILEEFYDYQEHWKHHGILAMLHYLLHKRELITLLLNKIDGKRRLTDLRHLGELLQEAEQYLSGPQALVRWFEQQIASPNQEMDSQQLRLDSDIPLVKITTIHKAKGLEYSLVWLPFVCSFRQSYQSIYHDRQDQSAILDLRNCQQSLSWAIQESLAEDLRLLYVALTRAVFHCSLGVANIGDTSKDNDVNKNGQSCSALIYLLRQITEKPFSWDSFLTTYQIPEIAAMPVNSIPTIAKISHHPSPSINLSARTFSTKACYYWRVTSYSDICQLHTPSATIALTSITNPSDVAHNTSLTTIEQQDYSIEYFPKGKDAGIFLHRILQNLDFNAPNNYDWLCKQLLQHGINIQWATALHQWIKMIFTTTLNQENLCLKALSREQKIAEMRFYLPLNNDVRPHVLDQLLSKYDPIAQNAPPLKFQQVTGMLQGVIDLFFYWQGRYYLIDYKSHWLGNNLALYSTQALEGVMRQYRYDVQYSLYTTALHRYLKHRVSDYKYDIDFGGIFYLFLRGMRQHGSKYGIFFHKPSAELIYILDAWFAGKKI